MAYVRRTRDEFDLRANYGQGYETITCEATRREARAQMRCYRENGDHAPMRIVRVRVPIASGT